MYRYSQHVRDGMGVSRAQRRILGILCLILTAAVIVLGVIAFQSTAFRSEHAALQEKRLLNEATLALNQYNNLSRTGGSSTSGVLGKIRQHVYAVQVLEEMNASLNGAGSRKVDETFFSQVYSVLDAFEVKLQTGQASTEQQAQLLDQLNWLVSVYR